MKPRDYAVAFLVPLAVALTLALPILDRIHGLSLDTLFLLRNAIEPSPIDPAQSLSVVVGIDEQTYRTKPFKGLPKVFWTRQLADVIDALVAADVSSIGFDLILSTSVEPFIKNYDRALRIALKRAATQNKVVLGTTTLGGHPVEPLNVYRMLVRGKNIRPLNVITDIDGVVRRMPLLFRRGGTKSSADGRRDNAVAADELVPSMSLTLASRLLGADPVVDKTGAVTLNGYRIPAKPNDEMNLLIDDKQVSLANDLVVDLYAGPSSIPTFSLADLYHCAAAGNTQFFQRHFEGKAVMLGVVLDVEDRKLTSIRYAQHGDGPRAPEICNAELETLGQDGPTSWQRQLIPGVYLHAAAINNIALAHTLQPISKVFQVAITALLSIAMAFCVMSVTSLRSGILFLAGAGAWTGVATGAFVAGWVLPLFHPILAAAITLGIQTGYRFTVTDRVGRHVRKAFGRILSPSLVDRMVEQGNMPTQGGELREITVWISDLENYTTISEALPPSELVDFLNEVYTVMSDTIEEFDGFVPQFVGDAVVAAFGAPLEDPDHARHGIEAAMACCERVADLGGRLDLPQGFKLRIRIGVSTGPLLVGYIGSKRRLSYTLVGDDINLASRLEGVNKIYGSTILVNGVTKDLCGPDIAFREIDIVRVKGRDAPVHIFEPLGKTAGIMAEDQQHLQLFAEALSAFRAQEFEAAADMFDSLTGRDPVAGKFAQRARAMAADPPPADWDGVNTMLTK